MEQALRKTEKAAPYVAQAHRLLDRLKEINTPSDLIGLDDIRDELVTAAGFSDKAAGYFSSGEIDDSLLTILRAIESESGEKWREEILYRFLLTRGDSLGGTMRNITGAIAQVKFTQAVLEALKTKAVKYQVKTSPGNSNKVQRIVWPDRVCFFDKTPKFIGKNIDVILHDGCDTSNDALSEQSKYLACGELKGGIDPAGADEHWKTAGSALQRIRQSFSKNPPKMFFAGAAIEESMAEEIFAQLKSGQLVHAANLTVPEQVFDLATWLVAL
ncbi:MAG: AvaI/BsoBI family type II restriction endonuclease [Planctomycetota bacterium]|nr:AvaI/BsoBI family type II restriction endonuclease [Planctomycetota bacterium]